MTDAEVILSAHCVSRRFGRRFAVRDVSVDVKRGDILLCMGHNGAGKTTLIRLLAGLLKPSAGSVTRSHQLGVVAHHAMLYESLTGRENLRFFGRLVDERDPQGIDGLLERVGLLEHADRRVAAYSRGMVQRLAIARALLSDPQILLLDEPLSGLDETAAGVVRELLEDMKQRNRAVVVASHQIVELVDQASTVAHLARGRMVAKEPIDGRDAFAVQARHRELARDV